MVQRVPEPEEDRVPKWYQEMIWWALFICMMFGLALIAVIRWVIGLLNKGKSNGNDVGKDASGS